MSTTPFLHTNKYHHYNPKYKSPPSVLRLCKEQNHKIKKIKELALWNFSQRCVYELFKELPISLGFSLPKGTILIPDKKGIYSLYDERHLENYEVNIDSIKNFVHIIDCDIVIQKCITQKGEPFDSYVSVINRDMPVIIRRTMGEQYVIGGRSNYEYDKSGEFGLSQDEFGYKIWFSHDKNKVEDWSFTKCETYGEYLDLTNSYWDIGKEIDKLEEEFFNIKYNNFSINRHSYRFEDEDNKSVSKSLYLANRIKQLTNQQNRIPNINTGAVKPDYQADLYKAIFVEEKIIHPQPQ